MYTLQALIQNYTNKDPTNSQNQCRIQLLKIHHIHISYQ